MKARVLLVTAAVLGGCSSTSGPTETPDEVTTEGDGAEAETPADKGGDPAPGEMSAIVEAHNKYRKDHCAPPLAWSADLAKTAQAWANKLSKSCNLEHSSTKYGENLAAGTEGTVGPERAVEIWYSEVSKYDFKRAAFSMEAGHFTQVVWAGSKRVGCGTSRCKGMEIWVCNYDPAGNMEGDFANNVKPKSCKK